MRLIASWPGMLSAFLWGFAEGTLFFVVPDVFLSLVAIFAPRKCWKYIVAATCGALIGGALLYGWAARDSAGAENTMQHVPFVSYKMIAGVEESYRMRGIVAVLLGPLSGTPYKLYAVAAPRHVKEIPFLLATIPARADRFILICLLIGFPAAWLRKKMEFICEKLVDDSYSRLGGILFVLLECDWKELS